MSQEYAHNVRVFLNEFPVVEFNTSIDVWLLTTSVLECNFLRICIISKLSEEICFSGNIMNSLFSSLFSTISYARAIYLFSIMFIKSCNVG